MTSEYQQILLTITHMVWFGCGFVWGWLLFDSKKNEELKTEVQDGE